MDYQFCRISNLLPKNTSSNLLKEVSPILTRLGTNHYLQVIAAALDDLAIALAVSWNNPFHPHAEYVKLYIDNQIQEKSEVFNLLLDRLEEGSSSSADRLIYASADIQKTAIQALTSAGYELIRKTYEPTLSVGKCLDHLFCPDHPSVMTYREMMKQPALKNNFFKVFKRNYEDTHRVNPAAALSSEEWETFMLKEQPDLDLSLVGLKEGTISSYITVFLSEENCEIAWVGMNDPSPSSYFELKQLFKSQLKLLQKKGIQTLEPEIDTTDYYAFNLFSFLTFEDIKSFDTYRKLI